MMHKSNHRITVYVALHASVSSLQNIEHINTRQNCKKY